MCDRPQATCDEFAEGRVSGQYKKPVRVIAFNTAEGWTRECPRPISHRAGKNDKSDISEKRHAEQCEQSTRRMAEGGHEQED